MNPTRAGRLLAAALPIAIVSACRTDGPTSPLLQEHATPSLAISGGSQVDGNRHFYFLPPLVARASFSGTFDGSLSPTVEICELVGGKCGPVAARFSGADITVREEAYQAVWYTGNSRLDESKTYRIQVFLRKTLIGFADVDVVANGIVKGELDPDHVVIEKGSTQPIRFRIEAGLLDGYFVAISAGWNHSCGLTLVGHAYCWGDNTYGQLGDGNGGTDSHKPVPVSGGHTFQSISAGGVHTCGVTLGVLGNAYCWGDNFSGELGDGNHHTTSDTPVLVSGGHQFQSISAGGGHTCGVTTGGVVFCWGENGPGMLGDGNAPTDSDTPVFISSLHVFQSISAGDSHVCGKTTADVAYCWGDNSYGQLGDGNAGTDRDFPLPVLGGHQFQSVDAGGVQTCGVTSQGYSTCWGENVYGQLGDGNHPTDSDTPVLVAGGHTFQSISAGADHACGLTSAGDAYCWGSNYSGELGDGNTGTDSDIPVLVLGGHNFESISAGGNHTCGVTLVGKGLCWGDGGFGQLGDGNGITSDTAVQVVFP